MLCFMTSRGYRSHDMLEISTMAEQDILRASSRRQINKTTSSRATEIKLPAMYTENVYDSMQQKWVLAKTTK